MRLLARALGLRDAAAVLDVATATVGEARLTPAARFFVEQVMDA